MSSRPDFIDICAESRQALDEALEEAVQNLQKLAMLTASKGIMISRIGPGHYTAALNDNVPFGITRETLH